MRVPRHGPNHHYEATGGWKQEAFPMRTPTAAGFCPWQDWQEALPRKTLVSTNEG